MESLTADVFSGSVAQKFTLMPGLRELGLCKLHFDLNVEPMHSVFIELLKAQENTLKTLDLSQNTI